MPLTSQISAAAGPLFLLKEYITEDVQRMAAERLLGGDALIREKDSISKDQRKTRKLALLLVHAINPHEDLSEAEEALLRGLNIKALRAAKQNKILQPIS